MLWPTRAARAQLGRIEQGDDSSRRMSSMPASGAPPLLPCPGRSSPARRTVVREIARLQRPDAVVLLAPVDEHDGGPTSCRRLFPRYRRRRHCRRHRRSIFSPSRAQGRAESSIRSSGSSRRSTGGSARPPLRRAPRRSCGVAWCSPVNPSDFASPTLRGAKKLSAPR